MATANPFDLLGGDDNDDVSQLVQKIASAPVKKTQVDTPAAKSAVTKPSAKLPSKPLPPAQAVREARNEGGRGGRGGGGGRGYGRGRGGGGYNRDPGSNDNSFGNRGVSGDQGAVDESDSGKGNERRGGYGAPRGGFRGARRGGFTNGDLEDGDRQHRPYERRSGTGRGNEFKREGSGRGNWGTPSDEITQEIEEAVIEGEKTVGSDKPVPEEEAADEKKENAANEAEDKEPEKKEMTLEEYQKVLEDKRKTLEALKTEERKVEVDKELASMQPLSNKKSNDEIFAKLGSDKDKRKEIAEKEERAKKSLSINEFLKPAAGEKTYTSGGRGRGRGPRGGGGGRYNQGGSSSYAPEAPKIEDPSHFPTLGGK
ncbi:RGG repeats nuclear RNA binding protein A-like [Rutidosis leptorrhynchoides]|uniref:RGG repeats nuclear RNA binding protein A-like n=1 Tax=Rutidosis leptorrhynchoides TaxID=125765 RepID=UPI003A994BF7